MRKIGLFTSALLILLLCACSSENIITEEPLADIENENIEQIEIKDSLYTEETNIIIGRLITESRMDEATWKELYELDESQYYAWSEIFDYQRTVNKSDFSGNENLPDTLSDDNSLCIVVLGYQLNADGTMRSELEGRLERALDAAFLYENAYILVTGGGTASLNPEATEADKMAEWLVDNGISKERIIIENKSKTTAENALFSYAIIKDSYPEINEVAIVTSDYHIPLGCLLFETQFILGEKIEGNKNISVVANASYLAKSSAYFDEDTQNYWLKAILNAQ